MDPVRVKKTRQNNDQSPVSISIETEKALASLPTDEVRHSAVSLATEPNDIFRADWAR